VGRQKIKSNIMYPVSERRIKQNKKVKNAMDKVMVISYAEDREGISDKIIFEHDWKSIIEKAKQILGEGNSNQKKQCKFSKKVKFLLME
jgi:hypothetical protein